VERSHRCVDPCRLSAAAVSDLLSTTPFAGSRQQSSVSARAVKPQLNRICTDGSKRYLVPMFGMLGHGRAGRPSPVFIISLVATLLVGLGLGAIIFGSSKKQPISTRAAAVERQAISLPAALAGFRDLINVLGGTASQHSRVAQEANQTSVRSATEAAYREAFDGATVAYRAYSNSQLTKLPYVIAVRAAAPGLTIGPVPDPSYLGLATPPRQVKTVGQVACQIDWTPPTPAGQQPPSSSEQVVSCQRSAPGLTIYVGGSGFIGPADMQAMASVVDAAWSAVTAG
jgi:hypothetical protein